MTKLLWERGNLFTGSVYGVQVEGSFGSTEIYGPFSSDTDAWNFGMRMANERVGPFDYTIVRIETPHVRTIATADQVREHRRREAEATQNLVADMERDGLL